jgi:hypothetical protein
MRISSMPKILIIPLVGALAGCSAPLPEEGTADAVLYVRECGGCHGAIAPSALRPAMWEFQVSRMDQIRRAQGLAPMPAATRESVLKYLVRNAG